MKSCRWKVSGERESCGRTDEAAYIDSARCHEREENRWPRSFFPSLSCAHSRRAFFPTAFFYALLPSHCAATPTRETNQFSAVVVVVALYIHLPDNNASRQVYDHLYSRLSLFFFSSPLIIYLVAASVNSSWWMARELRCRIFFLLFSLFLRYLSLSVPLSLASPSDYVER